MENTLDSGQQLVPTLGDINTGPRVVACGRIQPSSDWFVNAGEIGAAIARVLTPDEIALYNGSRGRGW